VTSGFWGKADVLLTIRAERAIGKTGRRRGLGLELRQRIAQRAAKGETPSAIAKALGIDRHTAAKYAS